MSLVATIQSLEPGARVILFDLDLTGLGDTKYYFHGYTMVGPIWWQGNQYAAWPIQGENFAKTSDQQPTPTLSVGNVDGSITALCMAFDDIVGAKLIIHRTLGQYLDAANFGGVNPTADPTQEFTETWYVERKALEDSEIVQFELTSALDFGNRQLPARQIIANVCPWLAIGGYRGPFCGYTGGAVAKADDTPTAILGEDRCGGRVSSCKLRFGATNPLPYGGFPAAGLLGRLIMTPETLAHASEHALAEYPRESCGLVHVVRGKERYAPCRNKAENALEHFVLHPDDYDTTEQAGEIIALVHSHPDASAMPSEADRVQCEASEMPWHILAVHGPDPKIVATHSFEPTGYQAPLVGRSFHWGVLDCWTLVRDWFARERGIELMNFDYAPEWWNHGEDLYMQNFRKAGFVEATGPLQVGDCFLMQIRSPVANHAAIYIGDGQMLQHLQGRLSSRDVYGGQWQEKTRAVVRYV